MYIYVLVIVLIIIWGYHLKENFITSTILDTAGESFGFKIKGDLCLGNLEDNWCFKDNNLEFTVAKNNVEDGPDKAHYKINTNGDLWVNRSVYPGWIGGKLKENRDLSNGIVKDSIQKRTSVRISNSRRAQDKQCPFFKNQDGGLVFSCDNYDWEAFRFID